MSLDFGADPNAANPEGETPLMAAARTGKMDAVRLLLQRGLASGITLYAPAIILSTILGWPLELNHRSFDRHVNASHLLTLLEKHLASGERSRFQKRQQAAMTDDVAEGHIFANATTLSPGS